MPNDVEPSSMYVEITADELLRLAAGGHVTLAADQYRTLAMIHADGDVRLMKLESMKNMLDPDDAAEDAPDFSN